jgi:BMFP domain-containing protein YqiC
LGEEFGSPFTRLDWVSRDRFDIQWRRHTETRLCLYRGLPLAEALRTIEADELLHPR